MFRWSSSVQTVCEYCKSILVRTDVDLQERSAKSPTCRPTALPSRSAPRALYNRQAFVAIGRIIYEYEQGSWNEWHLMMQTAPAAGSPTRRMSTRCPFAAPGRKLPEAECHVGQRPYTWDDEEYAVTTITNAHYRGVEGELPFQYWDKDEVVFVDLATDKRQIRHARLQRRGAGAHIWARSLSLRTLHFKNLRTFEGWS